MRARLHTNFGGMLIRFDRERSSMKRVNNYNSALPTDPINIRIVSRGAKLAFSS